MRRESIFFSSSFFFSRELSGNIPSDTTTEPLRQRRGLSHHEESRSVTAGQENTMSTSFEQLKREAVNLERQLEDKIGRYQQVRLTRKNYEGGGIRQGMLILFINYIFHPSHNDEFESSMTMSVLKFL